jgi:hypothetical protein
MYLRFKNNRIKNELISNGLDVRVEVTASGFGHHFVKKCDKSLFCLRSNSALFCEVEELPKETI